MDGSNNEIDNLVANIASTTDGGVNGRIFALCALDMGNYTLPANGARSRESLLEQLLNHEYGSDGYDVDMVGMLMYAIAPYQEVSGYEERTKAKLDEGVEAILKEMREDYTFHSWGTVNSESVAQVICALASCGIDPYSDPRFGDGDRTILTQWMDMFSTPDGFKHVQSESASNLLATYESCYALQWYLGFLETVERDIRTICIIIDMISPLCFLRKPTYWNSLLRVRKVSSERKMVRTPFLLPCPRECPSRI